MTKPLDWNQITAERAIDHLERVAPLESREDWDVLPGHIRKGGQEAIQALEAIARFGHRGWLDTLMSLEIVAHRHGLLEPWRHAVESCLGPEGPAAADVDIRRGMSRANATLGWA